MSENIPDNSNNGGGMPSAGAMYNAVDNGGGIHSAAGAITHAGNHGTDIPSGSIHYAANYDAGIQSGPNNHGDNNSSASQSLNYGDNNGAALELNAGVLNGQQQQPYDVYRENARLQQLVQHKDEEIQAMMEIVRQLKDPFPNGAPNALAGHQPVAAQPNINHDEALNQPHQHQHSANESHTDDAAAVPAVVEVPGVSCGECGNRFTSERSLKGHIILQHVGDYCLWPACLWYTDPDLNKEVRETAMIAHLLNHKREASDAAAMKEGRVPDSQHDPVCRWPACGQRLALNSVKRHFLTHHHREKIDHLARVRELALICEQGAMQQLNEHR
ncbi:hypothetical protein F5Y16DRAFT_402510 [Xylariaceae sp. FL0255]|nr:hypothetical protein F5Y16DRAFT_402510 [Xylariaceae sp. FL0255]